MDNKLKKATEDLRKIYYNELSMLSHKNYYNALVSWIKNHIDLFSNEQLQKSRLDVLMHIEPDKYIISESDICLEWEFDRIGKRIYTTKNELVMSIGNTLWDLVTIKSGKDCPICMDDELRYVIAIKQDDLCELVLECDSCGWVEYLNGKQWDEGFVKIIPANIKEVRKYFN